MGVKSLAEAVILQSLEDLWDPLHNSESIDFFKGEGFKIYSEIAELNIMNRSKIIHYAGGEKNAGTVGVH